MCVRDGDCFDIEMQFGIEALEHGKVLVDPEMENAKLDLLST